MDESKYRVLIARKNGDIVANRPISTSVKQFNVDAARLDAYTRSLIYRSISSRKLPVPFPTGIDPVGIEFMATTTGDALRHYTFLGRAVAILNFGNCQIPGGGYVYGIKTQESELCIESPYLHAALNGSDLYPFCWHESVLYVPSATFVRDKYKMRREPISAAVITAAAPTISDLENSKDIFFEDVLQKLKNVIKTAYLAPLLARSADKASPYIDVLILGAFGCGASNRLCATTAATVFVDALREVGGRYATVCFAIPDVKGDNYVQFVRTFRNLGVKFIEL